VNRRAARSLAPALLALLAVRVAMIALTIALSAGGASVVVASSVASSVDPAPPVTDNDFIPQERNLSECVGLLDRPGCGSEERGGAGQTIVFVVMLGAMGVIFTRIAIGVRKNRAALDGATTGTGAGTGTGTANGVDPAPADTVDP
jgi:hypothetical protein